MRWIIKGSLKFPLLIIFITLALVKISIVKFHEMPVDALPEFAPPNVEVQTEAPGLSAPEVEELVTFNLEELLNGTPWLKSLRSISVPGLSRIMLWFEPGTDIMRARQMVSERLSLAYALPNVAQSPVILQPLSSTSEVMMVGLTSRQISLTDLSTIAQWVIRPALLSIHDVANVTLWGLHKQQLQVLVNPKKLQRNHVKLDQIISTTGNALWVSPLTFLKASTPGSGGWIDTPQQRIEVRHVLPIISPKELAQVEVEDSAFPLGKVANLVNGYQPLIGSALINTEPGLLLVIEKFPNANSFEITTQVEKKLVELQPGLSGIQVDTAVFQLASVIQMIIANTGTALFTGILLSALLYLILIYSWRTQIIYLATLIISLTMATLLLNLLGITLNLMLLAGLVLALVILGDDAIEDSLKLPSTIQDIEQDIKDIKDTQNNKSRTPKKHGIEQNEIEEIEDTQKGSLAKHKIEDTQNESLAKHGIEDTQNDSLTMRKTILNIIFSVQSRMVWATLITLLPVIPIFFLSGVADVFCSEMVLAFAIAILTSAAIALVFKPALSVLLSSKTSKQDRSSFLLKRLQANYQNFMAWSMSKWSPNRVSALAIVGGLVVILAIVLLPLLKNISLLPVFKDTHIVIQWDGPPGTSDQEMIRITRRLSQELGTLPGVQSVGAKIGRALLGNQIADVNSSQLIVNVSAGEQYDATVAAIRNIVNGYPGMLHEVQTYLQAKMAQAKMSQMFPTANTDIVIRLFGPKLQVLQDEAQVIKQALLPLHKDIRIESQVLQPEISIEVNLAKAIHYGLKPGDVRRIAATLIGGLEAGSLYQEQKIFPVVVWGTEQVRQNLTWIRNLLIDTPSGQWIPLSEVATVNVVPTPTFIRHDTVSRQIEIRVNSANSHSNAVMRHIKQRLYDIKLPLEYHFEITQGSQEQQNVLIKLLEITIIIAIIMFLLLQAVFNSFRIALVVFFSLPLALSGGVLMAVLLHNLTLVALFGLFAVWGIALRHAIMLIKHYQSHKQIDKIYSHKLYPNQFTPIIITTFIAAALLLPFIVLYGSPGLEIASPMAMIILAGIFSSTLYNLVIIPFLYLSYCENIRRPFDGKL